MDIVDKISQKFVELHHSEPLIFKSPGRINIIGEHTDYNAGKVLPAAIDKNIYMAVGFRDDDEINLYAADYADQCVAHLHDLKPAWKLWPNYSLGVINEITKRGFELRGLNIVFGGDIPLAVGLSSSAAITCATVFALNYLFSFNLPRLDMAKIAQAAEHHFVGVHCGLMDQFASLYGKTGNLIKLDCKTNDYQYIPFLPEDFKLVLFDTGIKHHLVSSAYNERRQECETGLALVMEHQPEVEDMSQVTENMLYNHVKPVNETVFKRCLYVIQENRRLEDACLAIQNEDFELLGKRMFETHEGLKTLYEVSCAECDFLVDLCHKSPYVLGARVQGGGFGGCIINLIKNEQAEEVSELAKTQYKARFGKDLKVYNVFPSNGTRLIKTNNEEMLATML